MCSSAATPSCVPEGSAAVDQACAFDGDCAPGLGCPDSTLLCRPYCDASAQCGAASCLELRSAAPVGACAYDCDPLTGGGCPGARSCYLFQATKIEDTAPSVDTLCFVPGAAAPGEACDLSLECQPGLLCANGGCRYACDLDNPSCPTGTCREPTVPSTLRGVRYGVCL